MTMMSVLKSVLESVAMEQKGQNTIVYLPSDIVWLLLNPMGGTYYF